MPLKNKVLQTFVGMVYSFLTPKSLTGVRMTSLADRHRLRQRRSPDIQETSCHYVCRSCYVIKSVALFFTLTWFLLELEFS